MDPRSIFSGKADNYARYRWDYAPQAIEWIFHVTHLSSGSCVADIGAGTGILSRHFLGRVRELAAVEPNDEMRAKATLEFGGDSTARMVAASAEDTTLPDKSVDLITVAQAIHWFDPSRARVEFDRILKPDGWLAILRNISRNSELDKAMGEVIDRCLGQRARSAYPRSRKKPVDGYFAGGRYQERVYPFQFSQSLEGFIGVLASVSYMPGQDDPLFMDIEREARDIFEDFSQDGQLMVKGKTEVLIGRLRR